MYDTTFHSAIVLTHAVYLVFGATGGIGSALSRRLAGSSVSLVLSGEADGKLDKLKQEVGGKVDVIAADARDPKAVCTHLGRSMAHVLLLDVSTDILTCCRHVALFFGFIGC